MDPRDGVATRHPHRGLDDRGLVEALLTHGHLVGGDAPAVVGADPPLERPRCTGRREGPGRVDGAPRSATHDADADAVPHHRIPWSSALAARPMNAPMRSSGAERRSMTPLT